MKDRVRWGALIAAVLTAVAVLVVAIVLARENLKSSPVAAGFTRVGGPTRIATAVDASHFWLNPPKYYVEVPADAHQPTMLWAAQCAIHFDAPLLLTARNPKRLLPVTETIAAWHRASASSARLIPLKDCPPPGSSDISRLSTLSGSAALVPLPQIAVRETLAPVVVFAAAWAPRDPPDVAVGMALAAHLASANREPVSLVVLPRYLQADHGLENQLRDQHGLVQDGVVLGSTSVLPAETPGLLRQLLQAADQQSFLAQAENVLNSLGAVLTALLALLGAGAVAGAIVLVAPAVASKLGIGKPADSTPRATRPAQEWSGTMAPRTTAPSQNEPDWLADLAKEQGVEVTVWLRSGQHVTGTINVPSLGTIGTATALRLNKVRIGPANSGPDQTARFVLVPVDDIAMVGVDVQAGGSNPPARPGAGLPESQDAS